MEDQRVWVWEVAPEQVKDSALLQDIYTREDVIKGITSGTPIKLEDGWWKDKKYTHVVVEMASSVWPGLSDTIGTYFYELNHCNALLHVNILPGYQYPKITTAAGKAFYKYIWEDTTITTLLGVIPVHNRAANVYAKRFGWESLTTEPLVANGVSVNSYWHEMTGEEYE